MTGFSFPPPPPPPPKATSSSQQAPPAQSNSRGGRGGRGNRGGFRGRGGGQQRGGRPQQPQYQNYDNNSNYGQNQSNFQQNYNNTAPYQQQYPQAPPGSYINPAFSGLRGQSQAPVPQYGQPPVYQNPAYQNDTGASNSWSGQKRTREQAFPQGQRHPMKKPPSAPKPQVAPAVPSFGAPVSLPPKPSSTSTAPSVSTKPRVSANLGLLPQTYTSDHESSASEDEEDEELDEEAALGTLKSGPLTFEINGEISTLKSEAEIAEWVEERRKMWPSRRRIEEKQAEVRGRMEERRRIEEETRNAIAIASGGVYQPVRRDDRTWQRLERTQQHEEIPTQQHQQQETQLTNPTLNETRKELETQMQKVAELQRLLAEKEANADTETQEDIAALTFEKSKAEELLQQTSKATGISVTNTTFDTNEASIQPQELTGQPQEPTDPKKEENEREKEEEGEGEGEEDSDSSPEEISSKPHQPIRVPPPPQQLNQQPQSRNQKVKSAGLLQDKKQCISFLNTGRCKFGGKCRYGHDSASGSGGGGGVGSRGGKGRKTLFERMVEQEMEGENKLAVQVVKYLGSVGFFSRST